MINLNQIKTAEWNHIIYYEWHLDPRAGGPTGYLANLLDGLNRLENNQNPLIFFDTMEKRHPEPQIEMRGAFRHIRDFFYKDESRRKFYINHISRHQKREHEAYVRFLERPDAIACQPGLFKDIRLEQTKTIHVHTVGDAVKVKNSLKKARAEQIKIMLTSHTPEAPSEEYFKGYLEQGQNRKRANEIREHWTNIEKMAFTYADILVFPSKEAMEPLQMSIEGFDTMIKGKDVRFIQSGAKKLSSSLTKEEAKKKYGLEGKFVAGYVGRHNEIKGYDILKEAAQKVLKQDERICFLIGGLQGNVFQPLNHERWIEAGWVNPADLFMAFDVFVLPNRMTYFDLVLLEAMSMGVPVIASRTGGNKTVQEHTDTLILYSNTADALAEEIIRFSQKTPEERDAASRKIQLEYEQNYTTMKFAQRYHKLLHQIYADYHYI